MSRIRSFSFSVIGAVFVFGAVGCRAKPKPAAPEPVVEAPRPTPARDSVDQAEAARRAAERDRLERERLAREAQAARDRDMRTLAEPVYFGFDRSDLGEATRQALEAKVRILAADPSIQIRIEGHADDRGSGEYNIALGHRRAAAARRYLVQRDIDAARVEIVSFGEERPVCTRPDEGCWQMNRRAEATVVRP